MAIDGGVEPNTDCVRTAAGDIELHGAGIEQNNIAVDEGDGEVNLSDCLILGKNDVGVGGSLVGVTLNVLHNDSNQAHAVVAVAVDVGEGHGHLVAGDGDGTESGAKSGHSLGEFELPREDTGGVLATLPNCDSLTEAIGVELGAVVEAAAHAKTAQGIDGDELGELARHGHFGTLSQLGHGARISDLRLVRANERFAVRSLREDHGTDFAADGSDNVDTFSHDDRILGLPRPLQVASQTYIPIVG